MFEFKKKHTFDKRRKESKKMLGKFDNRIPVIVERDPNSPKDVPFIERNKYLIPSDMTIGGFFYVIRKKLNISKEKALFFFFVSDVDKSTEKDSKRVVTEMMPSSTDFLTLYNEKVANDGFLYMLYTTENTFGM